MEEDSDISLQSPYSTHVHMHIHTSVYTHANMHTHTTNMQTYTNGKEKMMK